MRNPHKKSFQRRTSALYYGVFGRIIKEETKRAFIYDVPWLYRGDLAVDNNAGVEDDKLHIYYGFYGFFIRKIFKCKIKLPAPVAEIKEDLEEGEKGY